MNPILSPNIVVFRVYHSKELSHWPHTHFFQIRGTRIYFAGNVSGVALHLFAYQGCVKNFGAQTINRTQLKSLQIKV